MSSVSVLNVQALGNPAAFTDPLQFEITFECISDLPHDLEWSLTYVGSAENKEHDQVLDSVLLGPVHVGTFKFILQAHAPDASRIPAADLLGVTVLLLSCQYLSREFVRVGYYVSNDYTDPALKENPPETPVVEKIQRTVIAENPRVTLFPINWDDKDYPLAPSEGLGANSALAPDSNERGDMENDELEEEEDDDDEDGYNDDEEMADVSESLGSSDEDSDEDDMEDMDSPGEDEKE